MSSSEPAHGQAPEARAGSADAATGPRIIRRIGWLHFINDLTLDFLTPLLPAGVSAAWIGVMEGLADGTGQVLKLLTGRASDRSGRRVGFVRAGYLGNAIARPLAGVGMLLAWPWWIVACRIGDRVGKGLRSSAADALVADWCDDDRSRAGAYARMRVMDHLGATLGGLAAALAAFLIPIEHLGWSVVALAAGTLWVLWICRGLADRPHDASPTATAADPGWWPRDPGLRRPLAAIAVASVGARISALLVLVQVAGLPSADDAGAWPLWAVCLGWAAMGLVQSAAAALAGGLTARLGPAAFLRLGWLAGAAVLVALAWAEGAWLIAAGIGFGIIAGLTEGAEKAWLAALAPKRERATAFGAMAIATAIAGLVGNGLCGWCLHAGWQPIFAVLAATLAVGAGLTAAPRRG